MKFLTMLLPATAAVLALSAPAASGQGNCPKEYVACVDRCITRPANMQDRCIETCQSQNGLCAEKVFGTRKQEQPAAAVSRPVNEVADARAQHEAEPAPHAAEAVPPREPEAPATR